jgi:hypothetical protein
MGKINDISKIVAVLCDHGRQNDLLGLSALNPRRVPGLRETFDNMFQRHTTSTMVAYYKRPNGSGHLPTHSSIKGVCIDSMFISWRKQVLFTLPHTTIESSDCMPCFKPEGLIFRSRATRSQFLAYMKRQPWRGSAAVNLWRF